MNPLLSRARANTSNVPLSARSQVLAVDADNGENGTVVYAISPGNPFYTINSSTGKIRTSGVTLDRESANPRHAALMRTIVVSAVDRERLTRLLVFYC